MFLLSCAIVCWHTDFQLVKHLSAEATNMEHFVLLTIKIKENVSKQVAPLQNFQ